MAVRLNSPIFLVDIDKHTGLPRQRRVKKTNRASNDCRGRPVCLSPLILTKTMLLTCFFVLVFVFVFVKNGKGLDGGDINSKLATYEQKSLPVNTASGKIPIFFIPNKGQVNKKVLFYAEAPGYTLWITKQGLIFDSLRNTGRDVSWLIFKNINKNPEVVPLDAIRHKVNYFKGKHSSTWKLNISAAKAVLYKNIYKNIDLKVYGRGRQVEYDWIIKPGGDPADIAFVYRGVKSTRMDNKGNLVIGTGFGELLHKKPLAYQPGKIGNKAGRQEDSKAVGPKGDDREAAEHRKNIPVAFKKISGNSYGFLTGAYDKKEKLIIDPLVKLDYSTYLGGSEDDFGQDIAVDRNGNVYITGYTNSLNFPVKNPCQENYGGGLNWKTESDVFITKLSADGSSYVYSTYLGGSNMDEGKSIAVDDKGCAYITGSTKSKDFPLKKPFQRTFAGDRDLFITKLSADGSTILYSTYLGGANYEVGEGIAVDSKGNAYVTGCSDSPGFPTENPLLSTYRGGFGDAFVTKLSAGGTALIYSTFIGGEGSDSAKGIAVDSSGCAYISGETSSIDFPVKNPFQWMLTAGGDFESFDAFVAKLSPAGETLLYSTYLGGTANDSCEDIAIDDSGCAYVTGVTGSSDFPLKNSLQQAPVSYINEVIFITKLCPEGSSLFYSTYLGAAVDSGWGIAVDKAGCAYITGSTWSSDFPVKNPFQESLSGLCDAFVTKLSCCGSSLSFSTYLGGSGFDQSRAIAVDDKGGVYITGYTGSTDFPVRNPLRGKSRQYNEAFITRLSTIKDNNE